MRVPRRFCRMTEGSSDDWPTRVRVLKKSVGLNPSAAPFLTLMRPASKYQPPVGSHVAETSRRSLRTVSAETSGWPSCSNTSRRSLSVSVSHGHGFHGSAASTLERFCQLDAGIGYATGTPTGGVHAEKASSTKSFLRSVEDAEGAGGRTTG